MTPDITANVFTPTVAEGFRDSDTKEIHPPGKEIGERFTVRNPPFQDAGDNDSLFIPREMKESLSPASPQFEEILERSI